MKKSMFALILLSVAGVSVLAYLPAVDNSFISDDFGIFPMLEAWEQNPRYLFDTGSEVFRLMSYVYFWVCFKLFGLASEPYYWAGIALHAAVSLLVYQLIRKVTSQPLAAWSGAIFFAAYERHQEAVMWISAANELILALSCVLFLLLWERVSPTHMGPMKTAGTLALFALALFSKEAAVVLCPIALVGLMLRGYSIKSAVRTCLPLIAMLALFALLWVSQADRNFFVTRGHYALGWHFIPVYLRSLMRLSLPAVPFLAAVLVIGRRKTQLDARSLLFFTAVLVLSIVPYSFLTYLDHIPSRNTYLPSVGLAGLVGTLFAAGYNQTGSDRSRRLLAAFLIVMIGGNVTYVWAKKDPQYQERAAPTRELIEVLNDREMADAPQLPVYVCGFPLGPWVFSIAVKRFTPFGAEDVVFAGDRCDPPEGAALLQWDNNLGTYIANFGVKRRGDLLSLTSPD